MSLAKAAFSGKVFREPQKRATSNNLSITYFTFDIGTDDGEELIRVRSIGNLAETVEKTVAKNDYLVVEGNLTMQTIKTETGEERRIVELNLLSFEKIANPDSAGKTSIAEDSSLQEKDDDIVKFASNAPDDLIGEDEIPF